MNTQQRQCQLTRWQRGVRVLSLALGLLLGLSACAPTEESAAANTGGAADTTVYEWKMITTWPKNLPGLGAAPERLAERLRVMSNGRLDIKVYGAGELVGALEVFDSVSQGTAQMGHGAASARGSLGAAIS